MGEVDSPIKRHKMERDYNNCILLGNLTLTFEQAITLLSDYIRTKDFINAERIAELITEQCKRLKELYQCK